MQLIRAWSRIYRDQGLIDAKVEGASAGSTAQRHAPNKPPEPSRYQMAEIERSIFSARTVFLFFNTDICFVEAMIVASSMSTPEPAPKMPERLTHRQPAYVSTRLHPSFSLLDRGGSHRVRETKASSQDTLSAVRSWAQNGMLRNCRTWPKTLSHPKVINAAALPDVCPGMLEVPTLLEYLDRTHRLDARQTTPVLDFRVCAHFGGRPCPPSVNSRQRLL